MREHLIPDFQPITFEDPPVNEVALALQFDRAVIDLEVLGLLAGKLKSDFPIQQPQTPVPPMEEPVDPQGGQQFQVQFGVPGSLPRTWFLSVDGHQLVQVQSDRIVVNWRRLGGEQPYPRYTSLRDLLVRVLGQLGDAQGTAGMEPAPVNFCELVYINEIAVPGVEPGQPHPDLARVIALLERLRGRQFLPQAEDAQLQARWRIPAVQLPQGAPVGRLYLGIGPGWRADTQLPVYAMNLTARLVPPPATDLASGLEILDIGHDWIVRAFADLTTEEMHRLWHVKT